MCSKLYRPKHLYRTKKAEESKMLSSTYKIGIHTVDTKKYFNKAIDYAKNNPGTVGLFVFVIILALAKKQNII